MKRQICFTIEENRLKEFEKIRDETGLPISRIIEIKLNGYDIIKDNNENNNLKDNVSIILLYKMCGIRGINDLQHRMIGEFNQFIDSVMECKEPVFKKYQFNWNNNNAIETWIEKFYEYCITDCRACFEILKEGD